MADEPTADVAKATTVDIGRIRDYADEALDALEALDRIRERLLDLADPRAAPAVPDGVRARLRELAGEIADVGERTSSSLNGIGYVLDAALGDEAL